MNKRETVQALMDAVQKGDLETAESMLADDFRAFTAFSRPIPEPINKEAWLKMSSSLKTAFPDLDYHFRVIGTQGDVVRTTSQLSGTHSGSLDLTGMNMDVIPATNKTFVATLEKAKITVKENKITAWAVEPTQGAGVMAILKQLEVEMPAM
jgi:predicted ester cyclase